MPASPCWPNPGIGYPGSFRLAPNRLGDADETKGPMERWLWSPFAGKDSASDAQIAPASGSEASNSILTFKLEKGRKLAILTLELCSSQQSGHQSIVERIEKGNEVFRTVLRRMAIAKVVSRLICRDR